MGWEYNVAAISLFSMSVQRVVEILATGLGVLPCFATDPETGITKGEGWRKLILVLAALGMGAWCANSAFSAEAVIFTSASGKDVIPKNMQVFVLTLIISGGTETFNSISKFLEYSKEGRKVDAEVRKLTLELVSTFTFETSSVKGGEVVRGVLTLTEPAKPGGQMVNFTSNSPAAKTEVEFVTIPAGSKSVFFKVLTDTVTASTPVTIRAVVEGVQRTASLSITP